MATLTELFTNIANAIRSKTGSSSAIKAEDFPSAISSISVGVEGGIVPTGTKQITSNGTHDVTNFSSAEVNVPSSGITPTGSITLKENKTFDVTNYASAVVDVPQNVIVRTFTVSEDLGGSVQFNQTIITGDEFIKAHYNDPNLAIAMLPLESFAADQWYMPFVWQSNRAMFSAKSTYYGIAAISAGTGSGPNGIFSTVPLTSRTYTGLGFLVNSNGNVNLCGGTTSTSQLRKFKAGTYLLIITCTE